jgi:hypothetical protein
VKRDDVIGEITEEKVRQEEKVEHCMMAGWRSEIIFSVPRWQSSSPPTTVSSYDIKLREEKEKEGWQGVSFRSLYAYIPMSQFVSEHTHQQQQTVIQSVYMPI